MTKSSGFARLAFALLLEAAWTLELDLRKALALGELFRAVLRAV